MKVFKEAFPYYFLSSSVFIFWVNSLCFSAPFYYISYQVSFWGRFADEPNACGLGFYTDFWAAGFFGGKGISSAYESSKTSISYSPGSA